MRQKTYCPSVDKRWILAGFLFTFLLPVAGWVSGQSGRRLPNQKSQPPATPPSKSETEEKKVEERKNDQGTPILIAYYSQNLGFTQHYSRLVVSSCAERLQGADGANVQVGREMNRKEASDFAKNSADTFVVLLQLENDSMRSGTLDSNRGYEDPRYLLINYTVFEPKTGKNKTNGRTYPKANASDPLSLPQTGMSAEYRLKRAAEEAADRIAKSLGLFGSVPRN